MEQSFIMLAGLKVLLSGETGVSQAMSIPGMSLFSCEGGDFDLHIHLGDGFNVPQCRWLYTLYSDSNTVDFRFGVDAEGCLVYCFDDGAVVKFNPRNPSEVFCSAEQDWAKLRFMLWCAFGLCSVGYGIVPIHASSVVYGDRAVLCLGESGAGKSTHTSLWEKYFKGAFLLNDDSPLLRTRDGEVLAYGSPWSGKKNVFRQESYRMAAMFRIVQAETNRVERLHKLNALTAVLPSLPPALAQCEYGLNALLDISSSIISNTPIYKLECRPDEEAARTSFDVVFPKLKIDEC